MSALSEYTKFLKTINSVGRMFFIKLFDKNACQHSNIIYIPFVVILIFYIGEIASIFIHSQRGDYESVILTICLCGVGGQVIITTTN